MELYQGIAQFNAGIGGTDEHTHRWYVHRMDAGHDDQELTAKIRETCLKRWVVLSAIPAGATSAKVKKKMKRKERRVQRRQWRVKKTTTHFMSHDLFPGPTCV